MKILIAVFIATSSLAYAEKGCLDGREEILQQMLAENFKSQIIEIGKKNAIDFDFTTLALVVDCYDSWAARGSRGCVVEGTDGRPRTGAIATKDGTLFDIWMASPGSKGGWFQDVAVFDAIRSFKGYDREGNFIPPVHCQARNHQVAIGVEPKEQARVIIQNRVSEAVIGQLSMPTNLSVY